MDEYFILHAYRSIHAWFQFQEDQFLTAIEIYRKLSSGVRVIWYEVDSGEDPVTLFTRLNLGRIRLTKAKLVKWDQKGSPLITCKSSRGKP